MPTARHTDPLKFNKNYKKLFAWEDAFARSVAYVLIPSKPIGVWEFLIPLVFLLNFMKTKQEREVLTQNLLFTKKLALEAVRDMFKKGHSRDKAMFAVRERTRKLLSSIDEGLYSQTIRERQLEEIDLLVDHYCRLMETDGADVMAMTAAAYQSRKIYLEYIESLDAAEKEVTRAAQNTLGEKADQTFVKKLEDIINQKRALQTEDIFPQK
jgi:hypothetical protein